MRIAMVCDFFYPNAGGVETHIYSLASSLLQRGHHVVVVTHSYGERVGVRHIAGGLKVYHLPFVTVYNEAILPTIFATLPLLRCIFIRERVQIVHGHSAFSPLCHDALLHAQMMGLKTVFTDHSLFGFRDVSSILTNKLLKFTLANVSRVVCVSHTSRANTMLRAHLRPEKVFVIPNAVDTGLFSPQSLPRSTHRVVVVCMSRLVYRKGMDLLAAVIPRVCRANSSVDFIIGGSGPYATKLAEMVTQHQLQNRVYFLGQVAPHNVPAVFAQGHIFLNCSLTEAFCLTIVEAASCGLAVVSTNVGGIPETLPRDMVCLVDPTSHALQAAVLHEVKLCAHTTEADMWAKHRRVVGFYSWARIAARTEIVYQSVLHEPMDKLSDQLQNWAACGPVAGKIFVCIALLASLWLTVLEWALPTADVDICPEANLTARGRELKVPRVPRTEMSLGRCEITDHRSEDCEHG